MTTGQIYWYFFEWSANVAICRVIFGGYFLQGIMQQFSLWRKNPGCRCSGNLIEVGWAISVFIWLIFNMMTTAVQQGLGTIICFFQTFYRVNLLFLLEGWRLVAWKKGWVRKCIGYLYVLHTPSICEYINGVLWLWLLVWASFKEEMINLYWPLSFTVVFDFDSVLS
jgi:hypothetical protein